VKTDGGTAVGGGTLLGLSKLLMKTEDVKKIGQLAEKGNLSKIDLSIGDIVGKGIGLLPSNVTACNFGKIKNARKQDIALGLIKEAAAKS